MSQLSKYFTDDHQASPFEPLANMANGADFLVAFRRNKRVGRGAGKNRNTGVVRNRAYAMTRNDVLDNRDLRITPPDNCADAMIRAPAPRCYRTTFVRRVRSEGYVAGSTRQSGQCGPLRRRNADRCANVERHTAS
jgi:hypothetical protein